MAVGPLQANRRLHLSGLNRNDLGIRIKRIHRLLGIVVLVEEGEERHTSNGGDTGETRVEGNHVGVGSDARHTDTNRGTESVLEEVDGGDERLHRGGGLGEGILETGDGGKDLSQTHEDVHGCLEGNVGLVGDGSTVGKITLEGELEARALVIDEALDTGSVGHGAGAEEEADGNTRDRTEGDVHLAEQGVEALLDDRDEDDDGDRVEVEEKIVGETVKLHRTGHGNERGVHLSVEKPEDGVEDEDAAGDEGTLHLVDELVSEALASGVHLEAVLRANGEGGEGIEDNRALRRTDDVGLAAKHKSCNAEEEEAEGEQERRPKVDLELHPDSGNG